MVYQEQLERAPTGFVSPLFYNFKEETYDTRYGASRNLLKSGNLVEDVRLDFSLLGMIPLIYQKKATKKYAQWMEGGWILDGRGSAEIIQIHVHFTRNRCPDHHDPRVTLNDHVFDFPTHVHAALCFHQGSLQAWGEFDNN